MSVQDSKILAEHILNQSNFLSNDFSKCLFHPDYVITFKKQNENVWVIVCLTCGEAYLEGPEKSRMIHDLVGLDDISNIGRKTAIKEDFNRKPGITMQKMLKKMLEHEKMLEHKIGK